MRGEPDAIDRDLVLAAVELMGRTGRAGTVRVQGRSMHPTLRPGQRLAVDFSARRLARGDMLVFRQGDLLLVHRLLGLARPRNGERCYRTRGDGVPALDPPVEPERVLGRVVAVEHGPHWLSTRGAGARAYAWCVAWHDLFWAAVGVVLRRLEGRPGRVVSRLRLRPKLRALDALLLRQAHRLCFERVHRRVPDPAVDES